jgi:hypothetical protein
MAWTETQGLLTRQEHQVQEMAEPIAAARSQGLLVAAERFRVSPGDLFLSCMYQDQQLAKRIESIRAGLKA